MWIERAEKEGHLNRAVIDVEGSSVQWFPKCGLHPQHQHHLETSWASLADSETGDEAQASDLTRPSGDSDVSCSLETSDL